MIESYFRLSRRPFLAIPDVNAYYPSEVMEESRSDILRCLRRGEGISLIIGNSGLGKSLLLRLLARSFQLDYAVALISNRRLKSPKSLLQQVLFELHQPFCGSDENELRLLLWDYLRRSCVPGVVLLIDEAQSLSLSVLEEIRMMLHNDDGVAPKFRVALAGTYALEERLTHPKLNAFNQWIVSRSYLEPLTRKECAAYISWQIENARQTHAATDVSQSLQHSSRETAGRDGTPEYEVRVCFSGTGNPAFFSESPVCFEERFGMYAENDESPARSGVVTESKEASSRQFFRIDGAHRRADRFPIFEETATRAVYELTEGVPRLINQLCNNALLDASERRTSRFVTAGEIRSCWARLQQIPESSLPVFSEPAGVARVDSRESVSETLLETFSGECSETFAGENQVAIFEPAEISNERPAQIDVRSSAAPTQCESKKPSGSGIVEFAVLDETCDVSEKCGVHENHDTNKVCDADGEYDTSEKRDASGSSQAVAMIHAYRSPTFYESAYPQGPEDAMSNWDDADHKQKNGTAVSYREKLYRSLMKEKEYENVSFKSILEHVVLPLGMKLGGRAKKSAPEHAFRACDLSACDSGETAATTRCDAGDGAQPKDRVQKKDSGGECYEKESCETSVSRDHVAPVLRMSLDGAVRDERFRSWEVEDGESRKNVTTSKTKLDEAFDEEIAVPCGPVRSFSGHLPGLSRVLVTAGCARASEAFRETETVPFFDVTNSRPPENDDAGPVRWNHRTVERERFAQEIFPFNVSRNTGEPEEDNGHHRVEEERDSVFHPEERATINFQEEKRLRSGRSASQDERSCGVGDVGSEKCVFGENFPEIPAESDDRIASPGIARLKLNRPCEDANHPFSQHDGKIMNDQESARKLSGFAAIFSRLRGSEHGG